MIVVLGGTKGQAYQVLTSLSDVLQVTVTPIDSRLGKPDHTKSVKVSALCFVQIMCMFALISGF